MAANVSAQLTQPQLSHQGSVLHIFMILAVIMCLQEGKVQRGVEGLELCLCGYPWWQDPEMKGEGEARMKGLGSEG